MNVAFNSAHLYDVKISSSTDSDTMLHAHKIFLLSLGDKFFDKFLKKNPDKKIRFELDIPTSNIQQLIEFPYYGECGLTVDTIENLMKFAHLYQILPVLKLCTKFKLKNLTLDNSLKTYQIIKSNIDCYKRINVFESKGLSCKILFQLQTNKQTSTCVMAFSLKNLL